MKENDLIQIFQKDVNKDIIRVVLIAGDLKMEAINLGCAITGIYAPDKKHKIDNIVAAHKDLNQYYKNRDYLGVVVGRYANRIAGGEFSIGNQTYQLSLNEGVNHLHGGEQGLSRKLWKLENTGKDKDKCWAVFSCQSPDGEEGYPGNMNIVVKYIIDKSSRLTIEYEAFCDKDCPVSLTNHTYFNLSGFQVPDILNHYLTIHSSGFTEKNKNNTPTGEIKSVVNTVLDFRQPKTLGRDIEKFHVDMGYDHNFVLQNNNTRSIILAAELFDPYSGRKLKVYTDQPGIQIYTANYWDGSITGIQGIRYQKHGAVALETQALPDSVHFPDFPNTVLKAGEKYRTTTIYEFSVSPQPYIKSQ